MLSRTILTSSFLLLSIAGSTAAPALWEVRDNDSSVWIFGGLDALPEQLAWRSAAFNKIVAKADRVHFEVNSEAFDTATLMPLVVEHGFNQGMTLLSDQIEPDLMREVREVAAQYNLDMPLLQTMKPWMAAVMISSSAEDLAKYNSMFGVAALLEPDLSPERVSYLETPENQLRLLAATTAAEQVDMLKGAVSYAMIPQDLLSRLIDAWANGKPEAIGSLLAGQFGATIEGENGLIAARHQNWIGQIDAMLSLNEQALVVVDIANLVGTTSLLRRLEAKGLTVIRVQ